MAGDELAVLVAQQPQTVIIIAHLESLDRGGTLPPRGANGVAACAQACTPSFSLLYGEKLIAHWACVAYACLQKEHQILEGSILN